MAGLTAGVAALAALPWWSVAVAGIGAFMVALGVIASVAQLAMKRSPFTPIIERGFALRERLVADTHDGSDLQYVAAWQTRVDDWINEARAAIQKAAPNREGAFMTDLLVADAIVMREKPMWQYNLLLDLDLRIEKLILVRASV